MFLHKLFGRVFICSASTYHLLFFLTGHLEFGFALSGYLFPANLRHLIRTYFLVNRLALPGCFRLTNFFKLGLALHFRDRFTDHFAPDRFTSFNPLLFANHCAFVGAGSFYNFFTLDGLHFLALPFGDRLTG